jgi:hypothetical protein
MDSRNNITFDMEKFSSKINICLVGLVFVLSILITFLLTKEHYQENEVISQKFDEMTEVVLEDDCEGNLFEDDSLDFDICSENDYQLVVSKFAASDGDVYELSGGDNSFFVYDITEDYSFDGGAFTFYPYFEGLHEASLTADVSNEEAMYFYDENQYEVEANLYEYAGFDVVELVTTDLLTSESGTNLYVAIGNQLLSLNEVNKEMLAQIRVK